MQTVGIGEVVGGRDEREVVAIDRELLAEADCGPDDIERRSEMKQRMFGSAMGEFTVAPEGEGWIVLEDGRRVGGTLRYPFPSREAAQRYVERELADEADMMAKGDLALSLKARAIRETDAGCKSHPATAPAGSNRSSYGGNEVAEAFG